MDIGQVRNLANQMNKEAADIQAMLRTLSAQIDGAPWKGNDRQRFVGEWSNRHAAALQRVVNSLQAAAREANEYARRQEWASKA